MSTRVHIALVALLCALFAALCAGAAARLGETADELVLWVVGGPAAVRGDWSTHETTFQGPVGLLANQALARTPPERLSDPRFEPGELVRARLGMLPFALCAALATYALARRLFGRDAGLLALACFVLHPLASGYGALVAVDMAHAALATVALLAALAHLERPSAARAALVGAACALALATKYLAALTAPVLLCAVLWAAWRARGARACAAAAAALAFAGAFLLALHAAYGFRAGLGALDPEAYRSGLFRAAFARPGIAHALALVPAPLLSGLDYQTWIGATVPPGYFAGEYDDHHPLYHVVGFLAKSPEVQVVGFALVALLVLPRRLARDADPRGRAALALCCAAALVPFLYLSLYAKLQVGIRYVLPCLPIGCALIGGVLAVPALAARRKLAAAAAGALVLGSALPLAGAWPNGLGYFNLASGGPGRAWRLYVDSNADWGQMRAAGLERLRARFPDLEVVDRGAGPRLGRVAVYVRRRAPADPEDPTRARHWVDALPQIAHADAAWLLYDASPEAWRAAADSDPRARVDLAVALIGAGRLEEAEREIRALDVSRSLLPEMLLRCARAARESSDPAAAAQLAQAWLLADRPDLALAHAGDAPEARAIRAQALVRLERLPEAVRVLEGAADRTPDETLLLAELYRRTDRVADGIRLLEAALPNLADEPRARATALLERLRDLDRRFSLLIGPSGPQ